MSWKIFGHLPFTIVSAGCVGWGNYPAAIAMALIAIAYAISGLTATLTTTEHES